jgi:hypothetical protein
MQEITGAKPVRDANSGKDWWSNGFVDYWQIDELGPWHQSTNPLLHHSINPPIHFRWPASIKVMQRTFNPLNRERYPGGPPIQ